MRKFLALFILVYVITGLQAQERGLIVKPYNNSLNSPLKGDSGNRKAALIIGISDYSSKKLTLKYANKDAALFSNYLADVRGFPKENIFILPDTAATSGRIYNSIIDMMKWLVAGDELVLYFAGHGDVQTVADFDEAFFLAWDASDSRNYHGTAGTLKLSDLELYTNRLANNKKVKVSLIMDACHSGYDLHKDGILKAQDNIAGSFNKIAKLLGCGINEFSYEADSVGHGLFTWYLVQGMMGLADEPADNKVTLDELSSWVKNRVSAATKGKQNPVMTAPDEQQVMANVSPINKANALALFRNKKYDGYLAGRGTGNQDTLDLTSLQQYINRYNYFLLQEKLYGNDSSSLGIIKQLDGMNSVKAKDLQLSLQNHLAEILETRSQLVLNEYLKGKSEQPPAAVYYIAGMDAALADSLLPEKDPRKKNNQVMESFHKAYSYIRYENYEYYPEAEQLLRKALALENRASYIYVTMSYLMDYQHKYDSAVWYAKKAEELIPTWSHPKNVLGNLYEKIYQYDQSLKYHRSVLQLDSTYVWSYNNIGVTLLDMERLKEAEYYFNKSLTLKKTTGRERLNRDWSTSYSNLAAIYKERGLTSKAEKYYAIADSIDPTYTFALRNMSELYNKTDGDKVEQLLKKSISIMPFEAENYYTLAEFYREYSTGNQSTFFADSLYRIAIRLNPFNESYYAGIGYLLVDEKRADSAYYWFKKGNEASGGTANSYYNLAYYFKLIKQYDSAVTNFQKVLRINPYDTDAGNDFSDLLLEKGDTLAAEKILQQLQLLHTQSPKIYYRLGNFYFRTKNLPMALQQYEKCFHADESYLNAINALAYVNLMLGNEKISRDYIKKLRQLDKDPFIILSYINAVAEEASKISPEKRGDWLYSFIVIDAYNEQLNELIAETAYQTGTGLSKAFRQAIQAEKNTEYNNAVLVRWLLLLSIELNDTKQMKIFANRYLEEILVADPVIQAIAMKINGNNTEAKKIKKDTHLSDIKMYRQNFKKIFSTI